MPSTTLHKPKSDQTRRPLPNCHDGEGALDCTEVLGHVDLVGRSLRFVHDDILAPGVTIGVHTHTDDEEVYYILDGTGTMTLDGQTYAVGPGDVTVVFPGGRHSLANTGDTELRMIVVAAGTNRSDE